MKRQPPRAEEPLEAQSTSFRPGESANQAGAASPRTAHAELFARGASKHNQATIELGIDVKTDNTANTGTAEEWMLRKRCWMLEQPRIPFSVNVAFVKARQWKLCAIRKSHSAQC
jgi:hypothetical protein